MYRQLPYDLTVSFQGHFLNYRLIGRGKPIIILHGALSSRGWSNFETDIVRHFRCYFVDLPGFGGSDFFPSHKHDINFFADAFGHFIKELKLGKTPIVASSMGTVVAVDSAAKGYTKGKLILVGAPGPMKGKLFSILSKIPPGLKRKLIQTKFAQLKIVLPILKGNIGQTGDDNNSKFLEELSHTHPAAMVDVDYHKFHFIISGHLTRLKNPVYFIYGNEDPQKKGTNNLVTNPILIPHAGHNVFTQNPKALIAQIQKILT